MTQDRQLQEAVLAELLWEPAVTATHIGVTTKAGFVTLTGHVPSYFEQSAARQAAARVRGVKAVADEIEVRLPVHSVSSDEELARAAIDRIAWEAAIPANAVEIEVENGWITLTGEVDWHYQRDAAQSVIGGLRGIIGITNACTIKPRVAGSSATPVIKWKAKTTAWRSPGTITVGNDLVLFG